MNGFGRNACEREATRARRGWSGRAEARDEYMKIHRRPRGRPQRVSIPTVDVVLVKPKPEADGN
jgi:hypothetical protein